MVNGYGTDSVGGEPLTALAVGELAFYNASAGWPRLVTECNLKRIALFVLPNKGYIVSLLRDGRTFSPKAAPDTQQ